MSYTTEGMPYGEPVDVLALIREGMIGEIVAINGYEKHIAMSNMEDLNYLLRHLRDEEIEHYYILLNLLRKYDKVQAMMFEEIKNSDEFPISETVKPIKKQSDEYIINCLRKDIKGELEAINLYEEHVSKIKNKEISTAIRKIINDEKEHVEELTIAIEKLTSYKI